ncbi:ImmA/IrrE family metallo-endopeptidase [Calothrix sp. NIES-2098]|uniref:ImmA/IrrE family metallo-endopeptidase n=1 Tax=Calothrix sp. NIES-2098 TaxID=1954171 RepID=UPI000B602D3E|nr:hypothetical protein NIES2098_13230 [Calothrix sp. NIES-2098]
MRYLPTKEIERNATELLESLKSMDRPVRVDAIAHRLGLMVEFVPLGEEVSGLLVIENGKGTIGINEAHASVRQRFTLAHEIGHYILHKDQSELFIDKKYTAIFRDTRSSSGELRREIQANQFAAALLMPRKLVENEINVRALDLGDDCTLRKLAEDFEVSIQAMAYRLSNMDIFVSS